MTRLARLLRTAAVAIATACVLALLAPAPAGAYPGGATISGVVSLTEDGITSPNENAMLYLWYWSDYYGEWVSSGGNHWVGAGGAFTIETTPGEYKLQAIVPGAPDTFWGGSLDGQTASSFIVGADEHHAGMDIRAEAFGSIAGSVEIVPTLGATPAPLQHGYAFFQRLDPATGEFDGIVGGSVNVSDGAFLWPDLIPGTYVVQVVESDADNPVPSFRYFGDAQYFDDAARVELRPGEDLDLGLLTLEPRSFDVSRLAGSDRFATAVEITQTIFPEGVRAPVVYLANGHKFPDALAAGPAAIRQGGAILTTPAAGLTWPVANELRRLDPERVVILGDALSVSTAVEHEVERILPTAVVDRLGGADRYETAELIIRDLAAAETSSSSPALAFVVTGTNFPDALAAAPAAATYSAPIILVPDGPVDIRLRNLIQDLHIEEIVIVGGEPSVSRGTADSLGAVPGVGSVRRVAGVDRYATAAEINAQFLGYNDYAIVATGAGFADALAGAPLAGALGAPLYLARPDCMPAATMNWIGRYYAASVTLLGGTGTLSPAVANLQPLC